MNLVIRLVTGEEFVVDPNEFEATEDGAMGVRAAIHSNVGVPLNDEARDRKALRIWPEASNVAYVAIRSESDRL